MAGLRDDLQLAPDAARAAAQALATLQEAATGSGWVLAEIETDDDRVVHTLRKGGSSRLLASYEYQVMTMDVVAVNLLAVDGGDCIWPE